VTPNARGEPPPEAQAERSERWRRSAPVHLLGACVDDLLTATRLYGMLSRAIHTSLRVHYFCMCAAGSVVPSRMGTSMRAVTA
jgi:hypothetical protein